MSEAVVRHGPQGYGKYLPGNEGVLHPGWPLLVAFLLLASGCAVTPGGIQESTSPFDGATELALSPASVCPVKTSPACLIRLGLFRRSTMLPEKVILFVVAGRANPVMDGESLIFTVDGEVAVFSSIDRETSYGIGQGPHTTGADFTKGRDFSLKRYLIDKGFLKKLIDSRSASLRIQLQQGMTESPLSRDDPQLALPLFREFYLRVFGPA